MVIEGRTVVEGQRQRDNLNQNDGSRIGNAISIVLIIGVAIQILILASGSLSNDVTGFLVITLLLSLLALKLPIGIAMILSGCLGVLQARGVSSAVSSLQDVPFNALASWELSVIPLFILMGIALWRSGLTTTIYRAANVWLRRVPGGLAIATNFAGAGMATASGSTVGISYALGRIAIPEMLRANYSPRLATGVVASAGALGQILPPSIFLMIYASIAQTSVGAQLLAGIVPGLLLAAGFAAAILLWVIRRPDIAPKSSSAQATWNERMRVLPGLVPIVLIIGVVLGGMFGGFLTATEAGAFGALATLLTSAAIALKEGGGLSKAAGLIWSCLRDSVGPIASVFLLLIGVEMFATAITLSGLAQSLTAALLGANLSSTQFLFMLLIVYLLIGMFLDSLSVIVLTVPVLAGPLATYGIDMVWFGIFVVLLAEVALMTPPIGMLAFIVHKIAQSPDLDLNEGVKLSDVFRGCMPFVIAAVVLLVILIIFPEIVTFLPQMASV